MMQISSTNYNMAELGMEDPSYFHQYPMDSYAVLQLEDLDFESFTPSPDQSYSSSGKRFNSGCTTPNSDYSVAPARPTKQIKTETTWSAYGGSDLKAPSSSSSPKIISFEHSNVSSVTSSQQFYNMDAAKVIKPKMQTGYGENLDFAAAISQGAYEYDDKSFLYNENKGTTAMTIRNQVQARDHVIAERKRREKLSQRFIALSAVLPGLKKMDKASVLEDAINYLKQLKERVNTLEEQVAEKTVETAIILRKSVVFADDDGSSSSDENSDQSLPEIEARVSGKDILIRIHCEKHNGKAVPAILLELEKHRLTVQSTSILPFGNNTLDITIVTQMNKEYMLSTKELIKSLSQSLKQLL